MAYNHEPLKCFDPSYYTVTWGTGDVLCIAPNRGGRRCGWNVHPENLVEISELLEEVDDVPISKRAELYQRIVLLRTCGDQHREKLENHPACLQAVAERYQISFTRRTMPRLPHTPPRTPSQGLLSRTSSPRIMYDRSGKPRHNYNLRPRPTTQTAAEANDRLAAVDRDIFVLYQRSALDKTVRQLLAEEIPSKHGANGFVYTFNWPSNPGYFKIGYTSVSVHSRMSIWRKCHPQAQLVHSIAVDFPNRIEELIHAELVAHRHKIVICPVCGSTHHEWFKTTKADVISTLDRWQILQAGNALFTPARQLAMRWRHLLEPVSTALDLTSLILLDDLKAGASIVTHRSNESELHLNFGGHELAGKDAIVVTEALITPPTSPPPTAQPEPKTIPCTEVPVTLECALDDEGGEPTPQDCTKGQKTTLSDDDVFAPKDKLSPPIAGVQRPVETPPRTPERSVPTPTPEVTKLSTDVPQNSTPSDARTPNDLSEQDDPAAGDLGSGSVDAWDDMLAAFNDFMLMSVRDHLDSACVTQPDGHMGAAQRRRLSH